MFPMQVVAALLATPLQSAKQVLENSTTQLDKRDYAAVIQAAKDLT